jgi:hypothetical protein
VDLGSKDAAMQTRGVWIIELSELDNLSHAEVARIKAFMSRTTDRSGRPTVCAWWNHHASACLPVPSATVVIFAMRPEGAVSGRWCVGAWTRMPWPV